MRIAILESIVMPAGHEVEFDRILVEELKRQGHEPVFFVPEKFPFKMDYGVDVEYLDGGEAISYAGVPKWRRWILSIQREMRRKAWFNTAYQKAVAGHCDAIIIPTASFRFAKSIVKTLLKDSPVPVYLLFHGIIDHERARFEAAAKACEPYPNIKLRVLTFRDEYGPGAKPNIRAVVPPVYLPKPGVESYQRPEGAPLTIGFFGQFRKEKQIQRFLEAFKAAEFSMPVELLVQGATTTPADEALFKQMMADYGHVPGLKFWHKNLIGLEWDQALMNVDALLLPYGAERYRYQCSAILFTAIGFNKPVLVSQEINPEVLAQYRVGMTLDLSSTESIKEGLEAFVNTVSQEPEVFAQGLAQANEAYSQERLVKGILEE
ncbi:MAG: glycosyltransferase [Veillonella sp.]|nr:glycosyltransferase [Veillonella sp.]